MFKTNNNKLGFIHIPKTGGTSIEHSFAKIPSDNEWGRVDMCSTHSSYKSYKKYYPNEVSPPEQWFVIVRHPLARIHSWYYYQIAWDEKRAKRKLPLKGHSVEFYENRIKLMKDLGLKGCLSFDKQDQEVYNMFRSWVDKTQWGYIKGADPIKVFKLEQISELYTWLMDQGCVIEYKHEKNNTSKPTTWEDEFDDEMIERCVQMYGIDFDKFDYEKP